jgi:hypothetical protein
MARYSDNGFVFVIPREILEDAFVQKPLMSANG